MTIDKSIRECLALARLREDPWFAARDDNLRSGSFVPTQDDVGRRWISAYAGMTRGLGYLHKMTKEV